MANKEYKGFNKILRSSTIQAIWDKMSDGTIKEFFDDWKWIFSFSKKYWLIIVFYTILGLVSSSLGLTSAYMAKELINIITEKQQDRLWILIAVMLGSAAFSLLFSSVMSRISTKISIYVNNDIQGKIFDEIIDSEWAELRRYSDGDLLNRFTSDVNTVAGNAIGWIPSLVINIYTFAVTFVVMVRMDSIMALIAFLSAPFLLLMSRFILRRLRKYRQDVLKLSSDMMSFEVETFSNFDMIKSFGIIRHYSKELRSWQKKYKDLNLDYNKFEIKANIMMSVLSTMVSMVAFFYCLFRLWKGQILFGDMTFFLQQRSSLSGNFNSLVKTFPTMVNSAVSAHRIRELVELQKEEHNKETLKKLQALAKDGISVEMHDASFFYDENQTIYEGGSFVARPGEIVAVLGSSGEGKTTLLRLFLGLLHPQSGSVTLRGADGEAIPVNADLRQLFSYVPQGNTVLSGTIAENMRMVKPDATDEEIVTALQTACAWEFVEKLPNGINSVLGDNGRGISVGQGQRISIARSLLRDSPILMLDEATSALDVETEQRVLHNIIRNRPNKTCIVSTHRPSVLNLCQRIYRIGDQKIEEVDKSVCEELQQMFTEG